MKNAEIKGLSVDVIKQRIATEKENLHKLKFAHAISPIENPKKISHARKLIAQLSTELTAKNK